MHCIPILTIKNVTKDDIQDAELFFSRIEKEVYCYPLFLSFPPPPFSNALCLYLTLIFTDSAQSLPFDSILYTRTSH